DADVPGAERKDDHEIQDPDHFSGGPGRDRHRRGLGESVSFGESTNAGYSSAASSATASPAPQSSGEYVFACVNKSGKIDYLEFRSPLPHQCWFSGETLWHFAALPAVEPTATPAPTPTPTPTPTVSAPAAAFPSVSRSASASAS